MRNTIVKRGVGCKSFMDHTVISQHIAQAHIFTLFLSFFFNFLISCISFAITFIAHLTNRRR